MAAAVVASACGGGVDENAAPAEPTLAEQSATTALAMSQGGALEAISFEEADSGASPLPAVITLDGCRQVDIVLWEITGTVQVDAGQEAVDGVVQFAIGSGRDSTVDAQVRVNESGGFNVFVPSASLSDLAATCQIRFPGDGGWIDHSTVAATPFEGVFTWDATPGSVASLGVGLIAGDRNDARRAWAEHHWFGQPLPFDRVLAVDRTLVGLPILQSVVQRDDFQSPCREITQSFATAQVTQRASCVFGPDTPSPVPIDVRAEWQAHGFVEGLVFEGSGQAFLVGSAEGWDVEIIAPSIADVITLASALVFYENPDQAGQRTDVPSVYPLDEDEITDHVIGADFREVGRFDTDEGRFLVTEGPLNPADPADFLRQLRVYRMDQVGRYWNPLFVSGGTWDRCLGATPYGIDRTFVITSDSGSTVEDGTGSELDLVGSQGRLRLALGAYSTGDLWLLVDGEPIVCSVPDVPTQPSTVPTTTGTTQPTTDGSTPPGSTDTTNP